MKMFDGESTAPARPLNFDTRWMSVFIFVEAAPISGPVVSGVDMVAKRIFADTNGNRTTVLELVSNHRAVSGYDFEASNVAWNYLISFSITIH
jgi:hypothetical protein